MNNEIENNNPILIKVLVTPGDDHLFKKFLFKETDKEVNAISFSKDSNLRDIMNKFLNEIDDNGYHLINVTLKTGEILNVTATINDIINLCCDKLHISDFFRIDFFDIICRDIDSNFFDTKKEKNQNHLIYVFHPY